VAAEAEVRLEGASAPIDLTFSELTVRTLFRHVGAAISLLARWNCVGIRDSAGSFVGRLA